MMVRAFFAALILSLGISQPVSAKARKLPEPMIDANDQLCLASDACIGKVQDGKFIVDGARVTPDQTAVPSTLAGMTSRLTAAWVPTGLQFGKPADLAAQAQIGAANTAVIQRTIAAMLAAGGKTLDIPAGADLLVAPVTNGPYPSRSPFYFPNCDSVRVRFNGTRVLLTGTSRADLGYRSGLIQFEECKGTSEITGDVTFDVANPVFTQGIVTGIDTGANTVTFTADWAPTWSDAKIVMAYRDGVIAARPFVKGDQGIGTGGIALTNLGGLSYRLDVSGLTANRDERHYEQVAVGDEIVVEHVVAGGNLISAINTDLLRVGPGITVAGSTGAVIYSARGSIDWQGRVAAPLRQTARGTVPQRMAAPGGMLIHPSALPTTIGGSISDVQDDALDIAAYITGVLSRDSSTQLTVELRGAYQSMPRAGERMAVVRADRSYVGTYTVVAAVIGGASAVLTTKEALPSEIAAGFEVINATTGSGTQIRDGFRGTNVGSACVRISAYDYQIGNVFCERVTGPLLNASSAGAAEHGATRSGKIGQLTGRQVNAGLGYERYAAVAVYPTLATSGPVAKNSFETVTIAGINIDGTNDRILAAAGMSRLRVGPIVASRINRNPTAALNGKPLNTVFQLDNVGSAEFESVRVSDGNDLPVSVSNVDYLRIGLGSSVAAPASGVVSLDYLGALPPTVVPTYTPTVSASAGTFASVSATGTYSCLGKVCDVQMTVNVPASGRGTAGGTLYVTLPFPSATAGWKLSGSNDIGDGKSVRGTTYANNPTLGVVAYDNAFPITDAAAQISISGRYLRQ